MERYSKADLEKYTEEYRKGLEIVHKRLDTYKKNYELEHNKYVSARARISTTLNMINRELDNDDNEVLRSLKEALTKYGNSN